MLILLAISPWKIEQSASAENLHRIYNESRPHMALNGMSPIEFARKAGSCDESISLMAVGN
jgi:hypothetical protein